MSFVQVNGLTKSYDQLIAVNDVSFEIKEKEIFGLLGPNGAGKSTLISMLSSLLRPNKGAIRISDYYMKNNSQKIKKMLGLIPQEIALYPTLTARENLFFWGKMYGLRGSLLKKRVEEALEIAGLTGRSNDRIDKYSGGMKRRINIAVALLHKPELLIMDEPTVGIDPQSRNYILETVLELNKKGMTIIYTSHYMEEVECLCSRIAIMDHGKIIALGTNEELKKLVEKQDTVEMNVKNIPANIENKLKLIDGIDKLSIDGENLTIFSKNAKQILNKVVSILYSSQCEVHSILIDQINLESVFLFLTGRSLRD